MILIICFGNPLRGDDAVSWRVAERLPASDVGARVVACHALTLELAPAIAAAEVVIFVAACAAGTPGEVRCTRIQPAHRRTPSQHGETAVSLLTLASARYRGRPAAYLITITAGQFGIGMPLSPAVADAVSDAVAVIEAFTAQVAGSRSQALLKSTG
jgi:hydrogenase maturation protease